MSRKTHADTVRENADAIARQQSNTYLQIMALADRAEGRGDHVLARQHRDDAANYADTRMSDHARHIVGI